MFLRLPALAELLLAWDKHATAPFAFFEKTRDGFYCGLGPLEITLSFPMRLYHGKHSGHTSADDKGALDIPRNPSDHYCTRCNGPFNGAVWDVVDF